MSNADEKRAFRNMRNMSAARLESGQALSGIESAQHINRNLEFTSGVEGQTYDGYGFPSKSGS